MKIPQEFNSQELKDNYRLVLSGSGAYRIRTKEEIALDDDLPESLIEDCYEQSNYAIYKGENGNIIIFQTYGFENKEGFEIRDLIDFVTDCLTDELNKSNIILEVTQCVGTTPDHLIVYDDNFYNYLYDCKDSIELFGEFKKYKRVATKNYTINHYKYEKIVNGKYSRYM